MFYDAVSRKNVVQVARGVVLLRSRVIGNPIAVDDELEELY